MDYKKFLKVWASSGRPYLFVFKNRAAVPPDLLQERALLQEKYGVTLGEVLFWFEDGRLPFQEDARSPAEQAEYFGQLYDLLIKGPQNSLLVTTWEALLQRYPPFRDVLDRSLRVNQGDCIDKAHLEHIYATAGYVPTQRELAPGFFFKTGESVSLALASVPEQFVKLEWFGGTIEKLWRKNRQQDPWKSVEQIRIFPAEEFSTDLLAKNRLQRWFLSKRKNGALLGKEMRLPKFLGPWRTILWNGSSNFLDWLPPDTSPVIFDDPVVSVNRLWKILEREDALYLPDDAFPRPELSEQWLSAAELFSHPLMQRVELTASAPPTFLKEKLERTLSKGTPLPDWLQQLGLKLSEWPALLTRKSLDQVSWIFCGDSQKAQKQFEDLMRRLGRSWTLLSEKHFHEGAWVLHSGFYFFYGSPVTDHAFGVMVKSQKLLLLMEEAWKDLAPASGLPPETSLPATRLVSLNTSPSFSEHFIELVPFNVGDYVAHQKHGIARFLGLETLKVRQFETEFCILEYAQGAKLYIPVFLIGNIHPYALSSQENIELSSLGSKKWEKLRAKATEHAKDVALLLLKQRAERANLQGIITPRNMDKERAFAQQCGFSETADQAQAIEAVLTDLASTKMMDRLICGEVGFGKTEVALRAAFNVILQKRQVMVLAPTTLLVQQHADRFQKRFEGYPVKIASLSRFCTAKQAQNIFKEAQTGEIDILIGTHKLLNRSLKFKDLGLFILDEEHRFGVLQKDMIAALTHRVDRLTLTATPIPRTLSMAMHGLKDLSLIMTPPSLRQPVKTFIGPMNKEQLFLAIQRELEKGGQIYYVSNRIEEHPALVGHFRELFPEARIDSVHGQLPVKALEKTMLHYYHGQIDLLICSVIIETGLDVANANTLIIEQADQFGLAQLHQLRGRVGRSKRQAYAYLYYSGQALRPSAQKRLEALTQFSGLGAGFMLAEQDLEIRGSGDLLGEAQSGKGAQVGIGLYLELVAQSARDWQQSSNSPSPHQRDCEIDLGEEFSLSKQQIESISARLKWYRRFASLSSIEEFETAKEKLIAVYGLCPEQTQLFLESVRLRIEATNLGVVSIKHHARQAHMQLNSRNQRLLMQYRARMATGMAKWQEVQLMLSHEGNLSWRYPAHFRQQDQLKLIDALLQFLKTFFSQF